MAQHTFVMVHHDDAHHEKSLQPFQDTSHATQSLGSLSTCTRAASGEPAAGCTSYRQATRGGALTMMLSMRPPSRPKRTPLQLFCGQLIGTWIAENNAQCV